MSPLQRWIRAAAPRAGVIVPALLLSSCAVNPATGERQLSFMSREQEIQMGQEADPDIVASMGSYPDEQLQAYVARIGEKLAADSERPDLPWTFRVLDDPVVNAFALPGGFIYVTRGILAYMESEAELAGVLGHEIGHVTARHSVNQISRAQLAQLGWGLGTVFVPELQQFEGLAGASMQLLFLKFGRDDERQSDELGVRYMTRGGYDPSQLSGVMGMLGSVTSAAGGERVPEWLSTHPDPGNREEAILAMADTATVAASPPLVERDAYLRRLEGLVFGPDPRDGFFQGQSFYHPALEFRMEFPQGWRTANLRQAVQAMSAEEDAAFVLTLGEGDSPLSGLRSFLAQEGIQGGTPSEGNVNGLPAASADFRYRSADGSGVDGRATFIRHGGALYQLLGYAAPSAWSTRRGAVSETIGSFRPLTDQRYLDVSPARLRIVTVSRATSFDAFLRAQGVEGKEQEVRLLNRIDGNATLEAGRKMKVPVGGNLPGGLSP